MYYNKTQTKIDKDCTSNKPRLSYNTQVKFISLLLNNNHTNKYPQGNG